MSISGVNATSLLAQLQQQLLGGYVAANSPSSSNSTDGVSQSGPASPFSGDDTTSLSGTETIDISISVTENGTGGSSSAPTGGPIAFGPGIFAAILQQLESQATGATSASPATTTASNATDTTTNATDATANSTDAAGNGNDPLAVALFDAIDTNGDGSISQNELENAFSNNGGTVNSADALYTKIAGSSNSDDGITLSQFEQSLPQPGGPGGPDGAGGGHHHDFGGAASLLGAGNSTGAAAGTTSQTTTNADGSTTTTITYADGTTVTITQPAAAGGATASASNSTDASASGAATGNGADTLTSQWLANFEQYMSTLLNAQNALFGGNNLGNQLTLSV